MPRWSLEFSPEAEKDLSCLDRPIVRRIMEKLDWFVANFESLFPIPLTGELREFYKLRVGDWRIFYSINWQKYVIRAEYIDNRDKAYKKK